MLRLVVFLNIRHSNPLSSSFGDFLLTMVFFMLRYVYMSFSNYLHITKTSGQVYQLREICMDTEDELEQIPVIFESKDVTKVLHAANIVDHSGMIEYGIKLNPDTVLAENLSVDEFKQINALAQEYDMSSSVFAPLEVCYYGDDITSE